jgi:hypothetical protein
MPGLTRKLLIFAAVDGLVLQPLGRGQRPTPTKIAYKDNKIGAALKDGEEGDEAGKSFEAFGIVGKLVEDDLRSVYPSTIDNVPGPLEQ